jgi:nucleoside triphosphatase
MSDTRFKWSQDFPRITVGAFIRNSRGEILLTKSPKWEDYWIVCGGHIDLGETFEEALVRETKEEVGLDVKFLRIIKVTNFINNAHFHKKYHFVGLQCECQLLDDNQTPQIDNLEITQAQWFSLEEAAKLSHVLPETEDTIKQLLEEQHAQTKKD